MAEIPTSSSLHISTVGKVGECFVPEGLKFSHIKATMICNSRKSSRLPLIDPPLSSPFQNPPLAKPLLYTEFLNVSVVGSWKQNSFADLRKISRFISNNQQINAILHFF